MDTQLQSHSIDAAIVLVQAAVRQMPGPYSAEATAPIAHLQLGPNPDLRIEIYPHPLIFHLKIAVDHPRSPFNIGTESRRLEPVQIIEGKKN